MAGMRGLFKDTAIYGLSSMLGRFINWFLTPFYTYYLAKADVGTISNYYSITAIFLILLIMGLETGFFRFAGNPNEDKGKVYASCLTIVATLSLLFFTLVYAFNGAIANFMGAFHPEYVILLAAIIVCDAIASLPFVYLRLNNHPWRFAAIKFFSIVLNIGFNLFFIVLCPKLIEWGYGSKIEWFYRADYNLGYVLWSNLISSFITLILLSRYIFKATFSLDFSLMGRILRYSFPLVILGLAGIMNQHLDKLIYPYLLPEDSTAWEQLGVYAANAKIAVILVMFTQAFRFAFEPFIFSRHSDGEDKRPAYADATKFFIISGLFIFLVVIFYLDIIIKLIHSSYYEGMKVIPIIMIADLFSGVFFNLSLWYKLTDRTHWGAWFSLFGLVIVIIGNVCFVPKIGYMACAWSAFACYLILMLLSYFMGQKYYPVPYNLKRIAVYVVLAMALWAISEIFEPDSLLLKLGINTLLLLIYVGVVIKLDLPLSSIPYIGKYFKR